MESTKEEQAKIARLLEGARHIVGPILPTGLATLDGWTWRLESSQERSLLNRGAGEVNLIPGVEIQGERGWLNTLSVAFSDPETILHFVTDQWDFRVSPFLINIINSPANNTAVYCNVYNPGTPMGPMYGISWTPSQFWPYKTQVRLTAEHPITALTATSQVVYFLLGRHFINNEKLFYETIVRESERQAVGRVQVPIRRDT